MKAEIPCKAMGYGKRRGIMLFCHIILDHVAVSKEVPLKSSSHTNSHLDESPEETHEISPPKNKADHINTNTFLINTSFKLNHKGNTNNHKTQLKGKTIQ